MRIIAFITEGSSVRKILDHLGESTQPPRIAPARGPPLWEVATASEYVKDPEWDVSAQPIFALQIFHYNLLFLQRPRLTPG
jgi:hypothetical protein